MKRPSLVIGLDIGSSKVSAVAAEFTPDGLFRISAQFTADSCGVSRGSITDINESTRAVSSVIARLKSKLSGDYVKKVYVNISGLDIKGARSRGMIPISLRGREITRYDISRCASAAGTSYLPMDREVLHRITHNFSADDHPWVTDPLGLYASRLACEVYVITADSNHIQNITKCVSNAGCEVREIVFTALADGAGMLTLQEKQDGVLLLDMGSSLVNAAVFSGGALQDLEIIPFGSTDLKSPYKDDAGFAGAISAIKAKLLLQGQAKINSVTVTGEMALEDGFIEYLEEKLSVPVRMGVVKDLRGDISALDSIRLSTAIGLARYAFEKYQAKLRDGKAVKRLSEKVIDIFNNYF